MKTKDNIQILAIFTYAMVFGSISILLNDIREFDYDQFKSFTSWAKTANKNASWFEKESLIQWSYYTVNVGLFLWKAYLIYGFTKFIGIIEEVKNQHFFSEKVISSFKKIGSIFISYTIGTVVLKIILAFVGSYSFKLMNELKEEFTYLIPAGLAFYLLAEIFTRAKALKEENDLTI